MQLLSRNKFHETFQAINDHFINLGIFNIARFEQDVQHHIKNLRGAIQRCWMMMELLDRALIHSPCPSCINICKLISHIEACFELEGDLRL